MSTDFLAAFPQIQYVDSDFEPIPGTESQLVPSFINKKHLTAFVRRKTRQGINLTLIGTLSKADAKKNWIAAGFEPRGDEYKLRLQACHEARVFAELQVKYQELLLKAEYPNGIPSPKTFKP